MAIPKQVNIQIPLLKAINDAGGECSLVEAVSKVEKFYPELTEENKKERITSGNLRWSNRVQFARQVLIDKDELDPNAPRGRWRITSLGKARLEKEWPTWKAEYSTQEIIDILPVSVQQVSDNESNPKERLDKSYKEVRENVKKELLKRIMSQDDKFFERLVADLLTAMRYGDTERGSVRITGRSGDGGIDGECSTDPLGINKVFFQAKRWQNSVSGPEIREFVGALTNHRIKQGIFITTSSFTSQAVQEAKSQNMVKLIDGQALMELMIDYNVGIECKKSLKIPDVDEDYFSEQ